MEQVQLMFAEERGNLLEQLNNALEPRSDMTILAAASNGIKTLRDKMTGKTSASVPEEARMCRGCDKNRNLLEMTMISGDELTGHGLSPDAAYFLIMPVPYDYVVKCATDATVRPYIQPSSLDETITSVCLQIGMPAHIQGTQYVHEAVKMVILDPDMINRITKELYPGIGRRFDTTASKVERSIRHAVHVVWQRGRVDAINHIFGFTVCTPENKPTNGEFIALLANTCRPKRGDGTRG